MTSETERYSNAFTGQELPRTLVVEDDPVAALVVKKLLRDQGIICDLAENGKQAIEMCSKQRYPLVVSDWNMPEMNGIELCQQLRSQDSGYQYFILCTARTERNDRMQAFEAGVDDFLTKPLDRDELVSRLKVALRILSAEERVNRQKADLERAGEALQEMNRHLVLASKRFEELFSGLPVACFTFDDQGVIHEWNREAERSFGIAAYEAFQRPVSDILGAVWTPELVEKVSQGEGTDAFDWAFNTPSDETRHYACSVFALRNASGDFLGAISANLDVTERLLAEQRIKEQMQQINEIAALLEKQKLALQEANQLLEQRADTDGLTGLLNHGRFQSDLGQTFKAARALERNLSLIILDVDKFKSYNDTYGHQEGDEVLRRVAKVLAENSRTGQDVARYGGEEFVVILPDCTREDALRVAERMRMAIEGQPWEHRQVTASFGISTLRPDVESARDLLVQADTALYHSKENGRNRSTHFESLPNGSQLRSGPKLSKAA